MMNSAFAYGATRDDPVPDPTVALVMGGSGQPIPPESLVDAVNNLYIQPNFPGAVPQALFTPEGLYPYTGVKDLTLDQSVSEGVTILDDTITQQIAAGNNVVVSGISQSALVASLGMEQLDPSGTPSDLPVSFVLIGDPMNPNGGFFERFVGLTLPSLGLTFYGATPADDFPTTIYTLEYDGAADFPQYPIDLPADLNALAGFLYVHGTYLDLTPAQLATAIELPKEGPTLTTYYMIPVQNLPLLDPLRQIPIVGNPFADLIQPDLTVIVNLGYGSITDGWSQGPANVPTPFGLFPTNVSPIAVLEALGTGAQQGVQAAMADIGSSSLALPSLSEPLSLVTTALSGTATSPAALLSSPTDILNTLISVVSTDYAVLLPTADIALAAITSIPAYDASLFVTGLQAGNLLNAVGDPVAADLGLGTFGVGLEALVLLDPVQTTISGLAGLIP